jgi:hypothetical protein
MYTVKGEKMALPESFIKKFSEVFLSDDVDGMVDLVDKDCDWVIMATGETFHGPE